MKNQKLKIPIAEIFHSLQGEGRFTGTASIFIRVAGCNLSCSFCDTDFNLSKKFTVEEIFRQIKPFLARHVVLTGGEPTLYPKELKPLVRALQDKGYFVALETNGTSVDTLGVDWVTVSPKPQESSASGEKLPWVLKQGDELKIPFSGQDLREYEKTSFQFFYLQPIEVRSEPWGKGRHLDKESRINLEKTVQTVLQRPLWKLSLQTHKVLKIR